MPARMSPDDAPGIKAILLEEIDMGGAEAGFAVSMLTKMYEHRVLSSADTARLHALINSHSDDPDLAYAFRTVRREMSMFGDHSYKTSDRREPWEYREQYE